MLPDTPGRINYRNDNRAYLLPDEICQGLGADERLGNASGEGYPSRSPRSGSSSMRQNLSQSDAPRFDVLISPPDITQWLSGDRGIPGVITRESGRPGPHVVLLSLMHGNEFAGAIVLDRLLREHVMPVRGTLSFAFVNIAAFQKFDPRTPTWSRFVDEDINRLWEETILASPRHSIELERARELRPLIDHADVILDLHSMLWPSEPLILCGATARGRALGQGMGWPPLVVADTGHANGPRLIDYVRFGGTNATAVLVEAGQHWRPETVDTTMVSVSGLLWHLGLVDDETNLPPLQPKAPGRFAIVTDVITARTNAFAFVRAWYGGEVVAARNTVIAVDGSTEIRTPYDDCLLVMPSLRPGRGHTAVRLAKFVN
jgi:predicted deacylase